MALHFKGKIRVILIRLISSFKGKSPDISNLVSSVRRFSLPFPYLRLFFFPLSSFWASLVAQLVKNPPAMWDIWFDPWVGKIPWEGTGYPLQYSGLENSGQKEWDMNGQLSLSLSFLLSAFKYVQCLHLCKFWGWNSSVLLCLSCKICFHEEAVLKFLFSWRFLLRHWKSKSSLPALSLRSKSTLWTYSSSEICLGWGVIWIAYEASVFNLRHLQSYWPVPGQFSVWLLEVHWD